MNDRRGQVSMPRLGSNNSAVRLTVDGIALLPLIRSSPESALSAHFRDLDGCAPDDTTRQRNTHIAETRIVQYPFHPWRDRCVFIDDRIDRNGPVYLRGHVDETLHERALEIPEWMFDTTWRATGIVETPVVSCDALGNLQVLLARASSHDRTLKEAQCFEGGADASNTGFKNVPTEAISATSTDTHFEDNASGGAAEDDRPTDAIASPTLGKTPRSASGRGGRS
jgi:hypothetical protein